MRCGKCLAKSAAHSVIEEDRQPFFAGAKPTRFWDEQDREHCHDARSEEIFYRCSNGHSFSQLAPTPACPVDRDPLVDPAAPVSCGWAVKHHAQLLIEFEKRRTARV